MIIIIIAVWLLINEERMHQHHRPFICAHSATHRLTGQRRGAVLHLLRASVHDLGAGLRAPDVCGVHAGAVVPQQVVPSDADAAVASLPVLMRQHLAATGVPGEPRYWQQGRRLIPATHPAVVVPAVSQPQRRWQLQGATVAGSFSCLVLSNTLFPLSLSKTCHSKSFFVNTLFLYYF